MYIAGDEVQLVNHSEPDYNGLYGAIMDREDVRGTHYYTVWVYEVRQAVTCTEYELMEG